MRGKFSTIFGLSLVLALCASSALAQAEAQQPQYYFTMDIAVPANKAAAYEAAVKELKAFYVKHEYSRPWTVYRTDDFHYYILIPMKNMADFDALFADSMKYQQMPGFEAITKKFAGTMESETAGLVMLRNDLSYSPENPRVPVEEAEFIQWYYYYLLPEHQAEAEAVSKEWQSLFKSSNISDGFQVWMPVLWTDLPALVATLWGKSEVDFFIQNDKNIKLMGEKYQKLTMKTMALCRKFEIRTGTILRELSYVPKKK